MCWRRKWFFLDLILTSCEEVVENTKGKVSVVQSNHEMVEFEIFRKSRQTKEN